MFVMFMEGLELDKAQYQQNDLFEPIPPPPPYLFLRLSYLYLLFKSQWARGRNQSQSIILLLTYLVQQKYLLS